ncbi:MAG: hypothetical protein A2X86_08250 [Bdellovibrionales bacterium GWA2_49_15]|nr:MAG: hypothetical protein A2X86_08250 [Bdellovibrionales bacterium GWA2_49_15]HAZ11248.1 hypothetical protein [Bdellovibrionales bacterium]
MLLLFIISCSIGDKTKSVLITDYRFIRIIEKNTHWEVEKNCRQIKYASIDGANIQSTFEGYQEALNTLRIFTHQQGGTLAQIRDFTETRLWAYIYFCSYKYH